jgi:hypothetical protein
MRSIAAILGVAAVAVASFAAGRMSSKVDATTAHETCIERVRAKVLTEFRRNELAWEARHSPYRWPYHAAVYRHFERPNLDAYIERVRMDECAAAARR